MFPGIVPGTEGATDTAEGLSPRQRPEWPRPNRQSVSSRKVVPGTGLYLYGSVSRKPSDA